MQEIQETWLQFLSQEEPLEKGMMTHSSYSYLENPMVRGAWRAKSRGCKELGKTEVT